MILTFSLTLNYLNIGQAAEQQPKASPISIAPRVSARVVCRKLTLPELTELLNLQARVDALTIHEDLEPLFSKELLQKFIAKPMTYRLGVALDGNKIIGVCSSTNDAREYNVQVSFISSEVSTEEGNKHAHVIKLFVAEGYRGQGIGQRLLEQSIAAARLAGCLDLQLFVRSDNLVARNLYKKYLDVWYVSDLKQGEQGIVMGLFFSKEMRSAKIKAVEEKLAQLKKVAESNPLEAGKLICNVQRRLEWLKRTREPAS
ncbi:MAG: Acetyltransferase family [Bacillota bacterium]|jgi:ribosomal protein S18 acetylase RimI-like enzyme